MTDKPRAVLDTNVLVSALLAERAARNTPPQGCLHLAASGAFRLVTSRPLVQELMRALAYPRLQIPNEAAHGFTALIVTLAEPDGMVKVPGTLRLLSRDPDDNVALETAIVGRARFLVTGNPRHFAEAEPAPRREQESRLHIVNAREFVERLGSDR